MIQLQNLKKKGKLKSEVFGLKSVQFSNEMQAKLENGRAMSLSIYTCDYNCDCVDDCDFIVLKNGKDSKLASAPIFAIAIQIIETIHDHHRNRDS